MFLIKSSMKICLDVGHEGANNIKLDQLKYAFDFVVIKICLIMELVRGF